MSESFVRPIDPKLHPMIRHQYMLATPSIDALMAKVKRLVRNHTPGAIVFADPRVGKTYAIRYVENALRDEYPDVVCLSWGTENKIKPSEDAFFTTLLEAAHHPEALKGNSTRKRRRLIERLTELVDESGHNWMMMFADEAQRLGTIEYEWLRDVHDCLERKGIRMITLLVGQPQLLNQKSAFRQSSQSQIILRFMVGELRFDGLTDADSIATCLQGYDEATFPEDSDWTYTRFFFPRAYANGFRLVDQALAVWQAFQRAHLKALPNVPIEIPMQYFAHTVEIALEESMYRDAANFAFTPAMWDQAVADSFYCSALEELHLGLPTN